MRNTKSLLLLAALASTGCVFVRYGESGPIPPVPQPISVFDLINTETTSLSDSSRSQSGDTTIVRYLQTGEQCSIDDGIEYRILRCWSPQTRVKVEDTTSAAEADK